MEPMELSALEQKIGYVFREKALLEESVRHSSYVNEQDLPHLRDNERLEFLGDAVLNLVIGHLLMRYYPELEEGDLSRMRARLVNESQLAAVARKLDLGGHMLFGKGELQTKGHKKPSILADAYEALIAAVYLDGGFNATFQLIQLQFSELILSEGLSMADQDYKSKLQEYVQTTELGMPIYSVVDESGPDHNKTFQVQLKIQQINTEGEGKSKKMAEQEAARKALDILLS